jgi:hypothetical protein
VTNFGDPSVNDNGSVSILLGNGDGTFQPATNVIAGTNPTAIAAADFNADGRADLVTTNSDNTLSVLLGNGDGSFRAHVDYGTGTGSNSVALADFNEDGRVDLAVANSGGSISVLLGNGDGTFQLNIDSTTSGSAHDVHAADFNSDGKPDLVVIVNATVMVLAGNGDGSFTQLWSSPALGVIANSIAVGDVTSDRIPDLVVSVFVFGNATISALVLLQGQGDGTFVQSTSPNTSACENRNPQLVDFDGDGKLDLGVLADDTCLPTPKSNPRLLVLPGDGAGGFGPPAPLTLSSGLTLSDSSDLDSNGSPDLILLAPSAETVETFQNNLGTDFSISASPLNPTTVSAGQSATSTISLSLLNTFNTPVSLACTVQPAQAGILTCSLSSSSVTFDSNGKASATLTISTSSKLASTSRQHERPLKGAWLQVTALAFLGIGCSTGLFWRTRRMTVSLMAIALVSILISQPACSAGSGSSPGATNYTITVTGVSGSAQHSTTLMLMIK